MQPSMQPPQFMGGRLPMDALDPFPWYRMMRTSVPVARVPQGGMSLVFRYDDVQRVLSEHATFSSQARPQGQMPQHPLGASIISTDPPRHRQLRGLVSQAFTPRAVARLEPRIAEIVEQLLDEVVDRGEMDVIEDLAYPLPVIVIAELLGIPPADRATFKQWSDAVVTGARGAPGTDGLAQRAALQAEMNAYFARMIEERRRDPRDDLISGLLAAQIEGEHLSEMELLGFCSLLLVAGNETTTNLIGNAIMCFDEQPEAMERLRAQPALLPSAIEEVLRYRSPVQAMFRWVASDTELSGETLRQGERVIAFIGSANRDETQFPEADQFDIERTPNRHLAFGQGIHFCLGAPLARLEARIALRAMLERLRAIERVPGVELEALGGLVVFGVRNLPITFRAA